MFGAERAQSAPLIHVDLRRGHSDILDSFRGPPIVTAVKKLCGYSWYLGGRKTTDRRLRFPVFLLNPSSHRRTRLAPIGCRELRPSVDRRSSRTRRRTNIARKHLPKPMTFEFSRKALPTVCSPVSVFICVSCRHRQVVCDCRLLRNSGPRRAATVPSPHLCTSCEVDQEKVQEELKEL